MNTVLLIDDLPTDCILIANMLKSYTIQIAKNGIDALYLMTLPNSIDIVLLDLPMHLLDGFGILKTLREWQNEIPVIILSNADDVEKEIQGLELGAVDYIRKPLNPFALNKRIEIQLRLKQSTQQVRQYNKFLEETVRLRTLEIKETNEITINALVRLLEIRNIESSNHALRTKAMMQILCNKLASLNISGYRLGRQQVYDMIHAAPLHDIGKIGVPDSVLLKPGKLNPSEFEIMKQHVVFGIEALEFGTSEKRDKHSFIETAKELIGSHHEWFNGSGYPLGLKGTRIPLSGRLMAIIDVYDALTSKRVYKEALSHEEAMSVLEYERIAHFDPVVYTTFLTVQDQIQDMLRETATLAS
ncbi:HD domain-containing phosphohydrolase [uncultured Sphaerochaeta sp.]|uniref:HD domain-containing phosphohydrolase n=1 Tax=uncultured Sphaerochaeta sp. TaxID=886478 RepID=UPI002A0A3155|nr:HD domain-containing phosphohydrolase [uncultured Sphaerochaeta sp.]